MSDDRNPLPDLPIYENRALSNPGPADRTAYPDKNFVWRFAYGNMKYTEEEIAMLGEWAVVLVTRPGAALILALLEIYFLGVMDGVRTQIAQGAIDRNRVEKGSVQ